MSTHNADPSGFRFNGEPATAAEIETMERLTADILGPIPSETCRTYEQTAPDGATVQFRRVQLEEMDVHIDALSIALMDEEDEEPQLELTLNPSNDMIHLFFPQEDLEATSGHSTGRAENPLLKAARLAQELLESAILDINESALVRHMHYLALLIAGSPVPADANRVSGANGLERPAAGIIADLVSQNTRLIIERKEYGRAFNDNLTITLIRHAIYGDLEPADQEEFGPMPEIQIETEDRARQINRIFTKKFNGERTLEVYDPADFLDEQFGERQETEEDDLVTELAEAAGQHEPGKADVEAITQLIIKAIEADLVPDDFTGVDDVLAWLT